ncbi:tetratricopeptide repeat protein, partial [Streptomyces phyllanthi]
PAAATFTGRDEEVRDLLGFLDVHRPGTIPTTTSLLVGMAGVGKTALALHVAHAARHRGWFGGGVIFLEAHGYGPNGGTEAAVLAGRLLDALGVAGLASGREDLTALWHDRLAGLDRAGAPVLVVLDDVSTADQVASLLPGDSRHRMVITSRHDLADLDARHLRLGVLDSRQSVSLVDACLRVARPEDERFRTESPDTVRLAELCGGLPLALRTIASLLRSELRLSPGELAEELADTRMRLDGLSSDGMSAPVRAAFDLSLRHLTSDQARVFRLMSVNPGPHVSTAAMAAVIERSPTVARRILRSLAGAHLIERGTAAGASDTWTMHDLVRIYALEQAEKRSAESAAALDRLLVFYVLRAQAVWRSVSGARGASPGEGFSSTKEAMTWLYTERSNILAAGMRACSVRREYAAVNLVRFLGEYLVHQEWGEELVDLTRRTMNVTKGGSDKEVALQTLCAHAHALVSAGRPEDAVTVLRSELGAVRDDPASEGSVRLALGSALRHAGRLKEAASQSRAAARLLDEAGDLERKGFALINLGNALRLLDLPRQAIDTHHETAAAFRRAGDRYREAFSLNNLGNALADIGDHEASYAALRRAVELFRECGAAHLEISASVNLAARLREEGRHTESAGIWDSVAKLCHGLGNTERELAALSEAGRDLQKTGDFARLLGISERGVVCAGALDERAHEAGMVNNVAICLDRTKQHGGAVMHHVRAAVLYSGIPDSDEPNAVAHQIACALSAEKPITDPGSAGDVLVKAAALLDDAGLREWGAWLKNQAGIRLKDAERLEESVVVLRHAAATFGSVGDLARQGRALNNLGVSLRALSRYEESAQAIRQDLAICRDSGDRPGLATSLLNLAETLSVSGDKRSAVAHWQEALEILADTGADSDTVDEVRRRIAEDRTASAAGW